MAGNMIDGVELAEFYIADEDGEFLKDLTVTHGRAVNRAGVVCDVVEWSIGDVRGIGMGGSQAITPGAASKCAAVVVVVDGESIVIPILRPDDSWNRSGPQGSRYRIVATFVGAETGQRRTLKACPTLTPRPDGGSNLMLRLRLDSLTDGQSKALDF